MGFEILILRCEVWDLEFQIWDLGLRIAGLGFRVPGSGFGGWGCFQFWGVRYEVQISAQGVCFKGSGLSIYRHKVDN